MLRGPALPPLFPDVYVAAHVDRRPRSADRARLTSWSRIGARWADTRRPTCSAPPAGTGTAPAEVIVPAPDARPPRGLRVQREPLSPTRSRGGRHRRSTSPLRTAYDLARRQPLVEAVVAVDALTRAHGFVPRDLISFGYRHLGARGSAQLPEVARLANPLAESPMETRIRMAILADGLPAPVLQHPVGPYRLDMAYPHVRLGIEYDGRDHLTTAAGVAGPRPAGLPHRGRVARPALPGLRRAAPSVRRRREGAGRVAAMITASRTPAPPAGRCGAARDDLQPRTVRPTFWNSLRSE